MPSAAAFLREFARSPGSIGAIWPSSRHLARLLVECAEVRPGDVIVELGAGDGAVTRHLKAAHPDNPFIALEPRPELAAIVRKDVPGVEVVEGFAQELPAILERFGHPCCHRIVSGLPFAAWDDALQDSVLDGLCGALSDDGRFATFQYITSVTQGAKRFKAKLPERFEEVTRSRVVYANVPPAFVLVGARPKRIPR